MFDIYFIVTEVFITRLSFKGNFYRKNVTKLTCEEHTMNRAKVYFTDLRAKPEKNLLDKLKKLVLKAGIKEIDFKDKFTALKIHFGEPGNLSYIRSNYVACIVKLIKELREGLF